MAENTFIKSKIKRLPIVLISLILLCAFGCGSKHPSIESDPLAQYRDTLVGNFNGTEIDTLICELADTLPISYRYKIHSLNNTVLSLAIENANIPMRLVNEGDLDGNGTDEIGFIHYQNGAGCWGNYVVLTYQGGWKVLYSPYAHSLWLGPTDMTFDMVDLVTKDYSIGFVKIRHFDCERFTPCSINDMRENAIEINPQWISDYKGFL